MVGQCSNGKESNKQWKMCTDFIDLNKACLKDAYPLSSVDSLVDEALRYQVLNYLDAYSSYN